MDPKIDILTSLSAFLQFVFFVRWWTPDVAIFLLGFVSAIRLDFSMAMALSCVALVATVGRSASTKIALTGVVLICPVIALQPYLWLISSFFIVESKTHNGPDAAEYSTVNLPLAM